MKKLNVEFWQTGNNEVVMIYRDAEDGEYLTGEIQKFPMMFIY